MKCTRFSKKIPRLRRLASWSVTSPDVGATTGRPLALAKSNLILTSKTSVKAKAPLCKGSCRVATEGLFYVGFRTALFSETVRLTIPQSPSVTAPFTQGSLLFNRFFTYTNKSYSSPSGRQQRSVLPLNHNTANERFHPVPNGHRTRSRAVLNHRVIPHRPHLNA